MISPLTPSDIFQATLHAHRAELVLTQSRLDLPISRRITCALRDIILSPLHLIIRIRYLGLAIFGNLICRCNFIAALENLKKLAITILLDPILTLSGVLALITSPFTNQVNSFNSKINLYFLKTSVFVPHAKKIYDKCGCCCTQNITNIFFKVF